MELTNSIFNCLKRVIEKNDIALLNKPSYGYLYLLSGFIAHYDINGFKEVYSDVRNLINDIINSDADEKLKEVCRLNLTFIENKNTVKDISKLEKLRDLISNTLKSNDMNLIKDLSETLNISDEFIEVKV